MALAAIEVVAAVFTGTIVADETIGEAVASGAADVSLEDPRSKASISRSRDANSCEATSGAP